MIILPVPTPKRMEIYDDEGGYLGEVTFYENREDGELWLSVNFRVSSVEVKMWETPIEAIRELKHWGKSQAKDVLKGD